MESSCFSRRRCKSSKEWWRSAASGHTTVFFIFAGEGEATGWLWPLLVAWECNPAPLQSVVTLCFPFHARSLVLQVIMNQHDRHKCSSHVPCSTAWDPAPSSASQQPGIEGLSHFVSQTWGWWLRLPSAPTHGLKEAVRWADTPWLCRWERQRCCELPSAPVPLYLPLGSHSGQHPELLPKGWKTEVTGRGRSFLPGRAAFARVVWPWGLARGSCVSLETWLRTLVISELCSPLNFIHLHF